MPEELTERIIEGEFCVDCPLYGKYVSVKGTCFEVELPQDVQDVRAIRIPGNLSIYMPKQKCSFFIGVETRSDRSLTGIGCSYKDS